MISRGIFSVVGVASLCAAGTMFVSYNIGRAVRAERDEYKRSVSALLDTIEARRLDSAKMAYTISQVTLERDEFKRRNEEDAQTIKELGARLKDVKSVAKTGIVVETPINSSFDPQLLDEKPIKLLDTDQHRTIDLTITKDSIFGSVKMMANLTQYMYADYKHRFLWWKWGLRGIKQTIVCDNPNVTIGYAAYYSFK